MQVSTYQGTLLRNIVQYKSEINTTYAICILTHRRIVPTPFRFSFPPPPPPPSLHFLYICILVIYLSWVYFLSPFFLWFIKVFSAYLSMSWLCFFLLAIENFRLAINSSTRTQLYGQKTMHIEAYCFLSRFSVIVCCYVWSYWAFLEADTFRHERCFPCKKHPFQMRVSKIAKSDC
jgi:hypothetical protein